MRTFSNHALLLAAAFLLFHTTPARASEEAGVTADAKSGFRIRSADGDFELRLRGYVQGDGRFYNDDPGQRITNELLLRRVRPILQGTLYKKYEFRIMPDFGRGKTELLDAYLDAGFDEAFGLRFGKFKPPVGYERLLSATALPLPEHDKSHNP